MEKIKVIVVDDSAFMRKMISDMINEENDMEVITTARNGQDLIGKLKSYQPDVITLDVEMPIMDGLETLKKIKKLQLKVKVLMISSSTDSASKITIDCLKEGAVDFVTKPSGAISLDIDKIKDDLTTKIRIIYNNCTNCCNCNEQKQVKAMNYSVKRDIGMRHKCGAVVIAASTGGPRAVHTVIEALPKNIDVPVLVVQHMPKGFTKTFAERLNQSSNLKVVEASDMQDIERNVVYIAPGGFHMEVKNDKKIHLNQDPILLGVRPAADKLFISASNVYKSELLSVVLTGMGKDGTNGTIHIKNNGGYTLAQDKDTSVIYGMPKSAYETGKIDEVIPLYNISSRITELIKESRYL